MLDGFMGQCHDDGPTRSSAACSRADRFRPLFALSDGAKHKTSVFTQAQQGYNDKRGAVAFTPCAAGTVRALLRGPGTGRRGVGADSCNGGGSRQRAGRLYSYRAESAASPVFAGTPGGAWLALTPPRPPATDGRRGNHILVSLPQPAARSRPTGSLANPRKRRSICAHEPFRGLVCAEGEDFPFTPPRIPRAVHCPRRQPGAPAGQPWRARSASGRSSGARSVAWAHVMETIDSVMSVAASNMTT